MSDLRQPRPLCIDLCCGLGGWSEGFLAEGWRCVGFDVERHDYGSGGYPGELVLQDIRTLHGSQFRDAAIIAASPPCQEFSWMAMPWTRGKQAARALRGQGEFPPKYSGSRTLPQLKELFYACIRIQIEASHAAGRYIPMVIENVRGAQAWVGLAKAEYGSFMLWGDIGMAGGNIIAGNRKELLRMPAKGGRKLPKNNGHRLWSDRVVQRFGDATKVSGISWSGFGEPGYKAQGFNVVAAQRIRAGEKTAGLVQKRNGHSHTRHLTNQAEPDNAGGNKGNWLERDVNGKRIMKGQRATWPGSEARKAASAQIAKIPLPLSRYLARVFKPESRMEATV